MFVSRPRRGYIALMFLIVLPLMLLILLMVMMLAHLDQARAEAQTSADAAARAAALRLVDDASLLTDPEKMRPVLLAAQDEAAFLASQNTILGTTTKLIILPDNAIDSDVVFGLVDSPLEDPIRADFAVQTEFPRINAVQVTLVRSDARESSLRLIGGSLFGGRFRQIARRSIAILDRAVIGFRPVLDRPIPLVPLALLSGPTEPDSWERQVETGTDHLDLFRYTKNPYLVLTDMGDGLPEMTVYLLNKERNISDNPPANSAILYLGTTNLVEVSQQISRGILGSQLAGSNGQLVLGPNGLLSVPGTGVGPDPNSTDMQSLTLALQELMLTGAVRAWPLYTPPAVKDGPIVLSGFVAARVMSVAVDESAGGLRLVIQPTSMHYLGSVLAPDVSDPPGTPRLRNRYLSKVRLALPK